MLHSRVMRGGKAGAAAGMSHAVISKVYAAEVSGWWTDRPLHDDTARFWSVAHLIHIWAEAVGVAIAQNIRVVTRPGHVNLARKGLLWAAITLHTGTYMACNAPA